MSASMRNTWTKPLSLDYGYFIALFVEIQAREEPRQRVNLSLAAVHCVSTLSRVASWASWRGV